MLETPERKYVHGGFFTHIFRYINGIKEFQIVQERLDKIEIRIVIHDEFDEKQLDKIREIIRKKSSRWIVEFKFVEKIDRTLSGKYKFIINKSCLHQTKLGKSFQ